MAGAPNPGDFHWWVGGWVFTIFIFSFGIWGGRAGGGGIYLGRRYGLSNPASMVRLLVSPNREKGRSFRVAVGGVGFERS